MTNKTQVNHYYIGQRKQILDDYDSLGVIDDYLTNDIDVQSAALLYDFSTVLKNIDEMNTFSVLLFDIYGSFNLHKKLPFRVKFKKFMNFTQNIEIPEELYAIIGNRIPYMYECFHWSSTIIDNVFLGKIQKTHIDQLKEFFLSIQPNNSSIMYDIWKDIHTVLPGNNVTLFEYLSGIHNSTKTRKKTPNISTNKTYKNRKTIIGNIQNQV
jgi:hypothetical protein